MYRIGDYYSLLCEAKSQKRKSLGPWGLLTSGAWIKVLKQRGGWVWKSLAGSGRRQSGPRPPRGPWGALSPVFRLNQQREEHQPVSKKLTLGGWHEPFLMFFLQIVKTAFDPPRDPPSWSPNSTVFLIFVELAVVTPVERRTFVSVALATTKSKLGPIFFQNIFLVYILLVKKQKTAKNCK